MRRIRLALLVAVPAILIALPLGFYFFILDWSDRPYCHKQFHLSFDTWMLDRGTNVFPNSGGVGQGSLAAIREEMGGRMDWARGYRYVPGLREDDPGRLVLMYMERPTRWTWHGAPPTIFKERAWILVPVDFAMGGRTNMGPGECSERVGAGEFKTRLRETIEFVRTNQRPHWQTVVSEHTQFLEALEHASH